MNAATECTATAVPDDIRHDYERLVQARNGYVEHGNANLRAAARANEYAQACFADASLVRDQIEFLERQYPELKP